MSVEIASRFETVIGLEVHAQLSTASKMYCRCGADYADSPPNSHVCPVCLGLPGTLPNINRQAIEYVMMTAMALNCRISEYTKFDRKNYPYPDLMKGYQISQYDQPIGIGGWLDVESEGETRRIGITRVHMEEDVAKLLHRSDGSGGGYSLLDVNRSGIPLMEIVSEPDMRSPEQARQYLMKLRTILWYLGVSRANMEEGSFRCDANISIRPAGSDQLLAKVEVKNMNSFRAVFRALEYEAARQRQVTAEGGRIVQETRGWLEAEGKTLSQRSKEFAHDYRYFPEPDLPPLMPDKSWVEAVRAALPELPDARRDRLTADFSLSQYDAALLTSSRDLADYFEVLAGALETPLMAKEAANWLAGPVSGILNASNCDIKAFAARVSPSRLAELMALVSRDVVTAATGKAVLEEMFQSGVPAEDIIREKGLAQISDHAALKDAARKAIAANPQAVADWRAGKTQSVRFLVGQVMRFTQGRANPNLAADIIKEELGEG
jgi:aspartyl-tRNA(Asn)/glutamyl-tRNA(Gln) amidotransferase subunit B